MSIYKTEAIESFYAELIQIQSIKDEIINELGEKEGLRIINQFINRASYLDIKGDFEDIMIEFINNNADILESLTGIGSYGEFSIDLKNFGPLFWVEAQEFDPIKYFRSRQDALDCANSEYNSFFANEDDVNVEE